MKIAVIGAGNVGGRLGLLWAARGHNVTFGVRDPTSAPARALVARSGGRVALAPVHEAASGAEVIALAVPFSAVAGMLGGLDTGGTILIDCTNPVGARPSGAPSGGEEVARLAPAARVVKAFNTIGANNLGRLDFGPVRPAGFICGDDAGAKAAVAGLAAELGLDIVDAGPLANAGLLESLALLWIALARTGYGREIAFALLRR